jgi:glutamate dehydrogenase
VRLVADAWFRLGTTLSFSWMRKQIERLAVEGHWQAVARGSLRDNLYAQQRRIAAAVLKAGRGGGKPKDSAAAIEKWLKARAQKHAHLERIIGDMKAIGSLDFATASVAMQEISKLA